MTLLNFQELYSLEVERPKEDKTVGSQIQVRFSLLKMYLVRFTCIYSKFDWPDPLGLTYTNSLLQNFQDGTYIASKVSWTTDQYPFGGVYLRIQTFTIKCTNMMITACEAGIASRCFATTAD